MPAHVHVHPLMCMARAPQARLLSYGNARVVVIVDKSMEIAGSGVVPHAAIGHARVLTVERPEDQVRVWIARTCAPCMHTHVHPSCVHGMCSPSSAPRTRSVHTNTVPPFLAPLVLTA